MLDAIGTSVAELGLQVVAHRASGGERLGHRDVVVVAVVDREQHQRHLPDLQRLVLRLLHELGHACGRARAACGWPRRGRRRTARTPRARGTGRARGARRRRACLMILVCAAPPTRDTEMPALIAGRMPALKRSVSRKIWPSVIEITLVGTNADTSPACVSMIGQRGERAGLALDLALGELLDVRRRSRARRARAGASGGRTRRPGYASRPGGRRSSSETWRYAQACLVRSS